MAQGYSFQISDIRVHEEGEEFLMDIDVITDTAESIKRTTFTGVQLFAKDVTNAEIVRTKYSPSGCPAKGHIRLSDGVLRPFKLMDTEIFEKPRPEISIEEAERLLKCKIVRK